MKALGICCFFLFIFPACGGQKKSVQTPPSTGHDSQESPKGSAEKGTVFDMYYDVFLSADPGKKIGTRRVKVTHDEKGYTFEEYIGMEWDELYFEFDAIIFYYPLPKPVPHNAEVSTLIDSEEVMKASVEIGPGQADISAVLNTVDETGNPGDYEKTEYLPDGVVIFPPVLNVIGPMLLPEPGQVQDVIFARFPDNYDSAVYFVPGHTLVREPPTEDGSWAFKLIEKSGDLAVVIHNDAEGRCIKETLDDFIYIPSSPSE